MKGWRARAPAAGGAPLDGSDMTDPLNRAQKELLENLAALRRAVRATSVLKTVLDDVWFEAVEQEIHSSSAPHTSTSDPSGFLYDFCHPLRGVDWFEDAQEKACGGRLAEVDEDARLALWFAGVDPLRTIIPSLDARLEALRAFTIRPDKVRLKLAELGAARSEASFKNHLFELSVLGDLAMKQVLVDIEEASAGVDGVISIDGRGILVEATNTVQRVIPDFAGVFFGDPNVEINQVVKKLHKKVAEGRQLAHAKGRPTVLFLARTRHGAGRESAHIAFRECFASPDFAALSGVVLADSWKLFQTSWHPGTDPDVPLSPRERHVLKGWYETY